MKSQTNAEAVRDLKRYLDVQAPMVIKPTPAHFACTEKFVLVVASAPSFVISEFSKTEDAEQYCERYKLPFTRSGC
ncbi:hypothetical protein ABH908_000001 [Pseudomonas frederiksbergensis]|uniref:hypothetical protein n=1 Tax=Pseudomonas TaxID=286 RepID=UPI003D2173CF